METASIPGVIRFFLILIIGYYVLKFLARLLFPIVVRKVVSKAEQSFKQQYQSQYNNDHSSKQNRSNRDEIVSDTAKSTNPKSTKKVGEYVDYEEIE